MTDKKTEALKLALEALEFYENDNHVTYAIGPDWVESGERLENRGYTCVNGDENLYVERGAKAEAAAITIRSALAKQPAQQQFYHIAAANSALRDAQNRSYQIARAAQQQEPVAWMNAKRDMTYLHGPYNPDDIPLCFCTPQRKPLTDEELRNVLRNTNHMIRNAMHGPFWPDLEQACRAIEAAHGIKGDA